MADIESRMTRLEVRYDSLYAAIKDCHLEIVETHKEQRETRDRLTVLLERYNTLHEGVVENRRMFEALKADLSREREDQRRTSTDTRWKWVGAVTVVGGALTGQLISILIATGVIG